MEGGGGDKVSVKHMCVARIGQCLSSDCASLDVVRIIGAVACRSLLCLPAEKQKGRRG